MRLIMLIIYLLIIIFGVSFAALNANPVKVNFYVTSYELPVSVMMTIVLGIGILIGFMLFFGRYLRVKNELRRLKSQLNLTEREIKNLRSIPLQDQH